MKTLTMKMTIAVAALAAAAGNAAAQTYKAQIPMAFDVMDTVMAAGSYEFRVVAGMNGHEVLVIRNLTSKAVTRVLSHPGFDAPKPWQKAGHPLVAFTCSANACALSQLWDGGSTGTLEIPVRKLPAPGSERGAERATVVTLSVARTD